MPASDTARTVRPTRYYDAYNGFDAGFYTDHADRQVAAEAFELRCGRVAFTAIATSLGLQHWDRAQSAVRAHARRTGVAEPRTARRAPRSTRRTTARRFGIEVEYNRGSGGYGQNARIVEALNAAGINAREVGYTHDTTPFWKMTYDATVTGGELVSPIMDGSAESIEEVRQVVNTVKAHGGATSTRVGMHVHHDATDFNRSELVSLCRNLRTAERMMMSFVHPDRYTGVNSFGASAIGEYGWDRIVAAAEDGRLAPSTDRTRANRVGGIVNRYSTFNFNALLTYGTVEFRLLGGTLNTVKVRSWIEVGQAIMRASKAGAEMSLVNTTTPEAFTAFLAEHGELSTWAAERFAREVRRRNPNRFAVAA